MTDHFLTKAKAYAALIGSILTVLATTLPNDPTTQKWLGLALAVCTAVATFAIPNQAQAKNERGAADVGLGLLVVAVIGIVLLLFRVHFG